LARTPQTAGPCWWVGGESIRHQRSTTLRKGRPNVVNRLPGSPESITSERGNHLRSIASRVLVHRRRLDRLLRDMGFMPQIAAAFVKKWWPAKRQNPDVLRPPWRGGWPRAAWRAVNSSAQSGANQYR